VYLGEGEKIVLHTERILSGDYHAQNSGQSPKAPHVDVHLVSEVDNQQVRVWIVG
jgi:hypothetical protein